MARLDTNIVHFNARVRGMKSRLFTSAAIREMLDRDEVGHVIEVLLESSYKTEMAEALTRFQGADAVEEAVSRNLRVTRRRLIKLAEGKFEELLRLFLLRDDLSSVKSLLRCKHHGFDAEAAKPYLIPGPTMPRALQEELAQSESMEALAAGLVAWNEDLCLCLQEGLEAYGETNSLPDLEEALDRSYFVENARRLGKSRDSNCQALCTQLQAEIDRINLRTLFQSFEDGQDRMAAGERFLPEGALPVDFLLRMARANDAAGAMELLGSTPYRMLVEELYQLMQTHHFAPLERFFERIVLQQLRRMARSDVVGLSVVMEYSWLKYNEILNLRLVARGLAGHLPKGRVREELNLVS